MRANVINWLVYLTVFLLPWQTRWIFGQQFLQGEVWEYGVLSLFLTEILVVLVAVLRPRIISNPHFDWPLIFGGIFLIASLVSVYISQDPVLAIMAWLHVLVAFFFFHNLLDKRVRPEMVCYAFVLGLIAPAVLGLWQFFTGSSPEFAWLGLAAHEAVTAGTSVVETIDGRIMRAYGSFQHPNLFGGYLAFGLVCLMMLPRWFRQMRDRRMLMLICVLLATAFVVTFSRSAWLAFFISVFIGGWILLWEHRVAVKKALPYLAVTLVAIVVSVLVFWQPVAARFHPSLRLEAQSIAERTAGYELYWPTISENIWNGVGIGNYTVALGASHPESPVWAFQPIHNSILLIMGEVGVVGLIFFILWVASIDRLNFKALPRATAIGALTLGNVVLILALFDHYLFSLWPGLALVAIMFALTLRLSEPVE
jgi:O-antigen ligase